jgi:hypothetical protein
VLEMSLCRAREVSRGVTTMDATARPTLSELELDPAWRRHPLRRRPVRDECPISEPDNVCVVRKQETNLDVILPAVVQ